MAFKLKNPLKSPLKQNHQEQFGPQLPNNDLDPRDLIAPPAPEYSTEFPTYDMEGYHMGNVDGPRIIRYNKKLSGGPRTGSFQHRAFAGFGDERKPIPDNLNPTQKAFLERLENPEFVDRFLKQGVFGTGERVTLEDLENLKSATLNVPIIHTDKMSDPSAQAEFFQDEKMGEGGKDIIIGGGDSNIKMSLDPKNKRYNPVLSEELAHVGLDSLMEPALIEVLGLPQEARKDRNSQYTIAKYLNRPGELYGNFYNLRESINLKPDETIESIDALEKRLKDNKIINYEHPILRLWDQPEEREKLLEALNTIASKEQESPGTTKWNQLSAKEMLGDIEQDNQSMYS